MVEEGEEQSADVGAQRGDVRYVLDMPIMLKEAGQEDGERIAGQSRLLRRRVFELVCVLIRPGKQNRLQREQQRATEPIRSTRSDRTDYVCRSTPQVARARTS